MLGAFLKGIANLLLPKADKCGRQARLSGEIAGMRMQAGCLLIKGTSEDARAYGDCLNGNASRMLANKGHERGRSRLRGRLSGGLLIKKIIYAYRATK